jgi:cytochrome c oxidase subunit III
MKLLRILGEKSWVRSAQTAEGYAAIADEAFQLPPQKTALLFFLAVVSVMFGLFITAYFIRMDLDDWRPMPESVLLWLNTAVLFLASIVLQVLHTRLKTGNTRHLKAGLLFGALLTLGFVYGQVFVWQLMQADGYYMYNNPANSFFYILTGIHALHILGGLYVWLRAGFRVWFEAVTDASVENIRLSVELCALYWHFLLLVWLVLFALMLNT